MVRLHALLYALFTDSDTGFPMPVDVTSVTQGDKRVFSFMSQAIGLMSELDLGTEHLRFMGDR